MGVILFARYSFWIVVNYTSFALENQCFSISLLILSLPKTAENDKILHAWNAVELIEQPDYSFSGYLIMESYEMERKEILDILGEHWDDFGRFNVKSLALFGSVARNEARSDSDVDVLVEFSVPVGLFHFVRLKSYLEELLGAPVDLVTPDAIKDRMRENILKEAIYAT